MKTESDYEQETLNTMWKQLKKRIDSRQDDSINNTDSSKLQQQMNPSPYANKNYQLQIQALSEELYTKNAKLIQSQQDVHQLEDENQQLIEQVEKFSVDNQLLRKKLDFIEQEIDLIQGDKHKARLMRAENQSLRSDVKRLMELVKKTKEYSKLAIDDNQTYIKGAEKYYYDTRKIKIQLDKEEINWVPQKAKELIDEIMPDDFDRQEEILLQLNFSYYNHYSQRLKQYKHTAQKEIESLKRQLQHRIPFDGVTASKTIERLKKQSTPSGKSLSVAHIQDAFNTLSQKENHIKVLQHQIQQLEEQLLENNRVSGQRRKLFMEGAQWMLQKIIDEVIQYENSLIDLNYNLSKKIEEVLLDSDVVQQQIINKVYKWITDNQEDLINNADN
ncbi:hypothetical protein pb186bvf_013207 [Paramecium bursaria]